MFRSFACREQRASSPESVAEHGLTSLVPRCGWSQGRTPMATMAVRCCFHDGKEWLVSWIRTVLSDSSGGDSATPGRRSSGRMWNVTEQGHFKGHRKTCHPPTHPPPSPIEEFTARPHATYGEYWVWISPLFVKGAWLGLCLPVCEVVVVKLQTTMSWFERGNIHTSQNHQSSFSQWMFLFQLWTVWCQ